MCRHPHEEGSGSHQVQIDVEWVTTLSRKFHSKNVKLFNNDLRKVKKGLSGAITGDRIVYERLCGLQILARKDHYSPLENIQLSCDWAPTLDELCDERVTERWLVQCCQDYMCNTHVDLGFDQYLHTRSKRVYDKVMKPFAQVDDAGYKLFQSWHER